MIDNDLENSSVAPLRNVSAFMTMYKAVECRGEGMPGMGVFYGPSGYGKSTAALYSTNSQDAILVQLKSVTTRATFCEAILRELGKSRASSVARMVDQICEGLAVSNRALIIDEADVLITKKMIEIVRDIYEGSFVPVILIGEEFFPEKLQKWERVHGRVLRWLAAEPAGQADMNILLKMRCRGIEVAPDLQKAVIEKSNGSVRRMCVNLNLLREQAELQDVRRMELSDWKGNFYTGKAPQGRKGYE